MKGRKPALLARTRIPFREVNRRWTPHHDPALQRHHLLPCELLKRRCFAPMFERIGLSPFTLDDFRTNGMLLPAREEAVRRLALPLHRGPHRDYNAMVIERVGQIEGAWTELRRRDESGAGEAALMRLALLQQALRRRLLSERLPYRLNRKDPLGTGLDFTDLDAMAEELWRSS